MEENGLAPSVKKEIRSPKNRRAPRSLKFSKFLATRHEKNTGYQKVVRVGDRKQEIVETTFGIIFLFEILIH